MYCIVYLYIQDSTTLCTGWVHLTLWMSVPCVLSMRPYPDAPREGQPPLRQMMPHWVPRPPASTEDENDVSLSLNHQLFIHNSNCEDAPKMMSRSSVPIITKSHLAIFFCKNNQWWSYLNEKAIKAATNDCLHLQNKCCVTILLFLHMVLFSFGWGWKSQSVPLIEPQNWDYGKDSQVTALLRCRMILKLAISHLAIGQKFRLLR